MFARFQSMRRLTCIVGIVLTTLASLQQCHAFCQLGLCGNTALNRWFVQAKAQAKTCCRGCCGPAASDASNSRSESVPVQPQCPCGSECWCCQPVEPREVPRDSMGSAKSLVIFGVQSPTVTFLGADRSENPGHPLLVVDLELFTTSSTTCAQLCRFLT